MQAEARRDAARDAARRARGALGHLHVDQVAGPRDEVVTRGARRDDERDENRAAEGRDCAPRSRARRAPNPNSLKKFLEGHKGGIFEVTGVRVDERVG